MKQMPENVSPMSNEGRNAYVINQLTDACLSLLYEKPISEISISELCSSAGVGRASFYRNFQSKEDIIRGYISQIFLGWLDGYGEWDGKPFSRFIGSMFAHFERYRDFYSLLNERNLIYLLKDAIIGICGPKPEDPKGEAYAKAYVAYALYGWIEVWFQRGMEDSAEEIAGLFKMQELS